MGVLSYEKLCQLLEDRDILAGTCRPRRRGSLRKKELLALAREYDVPHTTAQLEAFELSGEFEIEIPEPIFARLSPSEAWSQAEQLSEIIQGGPAAQERAEAARALAKRREEERLARASAEAVKRAEAKRLADIRQAKEAAEREARAREQRLQREQQQAEAKAEWDRKALERQLLKQQQEAEAKQRAEAKRAEQERKALERKEQREQEKRQREEEKALRELQALTAKQEREKEEALRKAKERADQEAARQLKELEKQKKQQEEKAKPKEKAIVPPPPAPVTKPKQPTEWELIQQKSAEKKKEAELAQAAQALSKTIEPEEKGCAFDSIKDLINVNTEPLTVLSVYLACKKFDLPIRTGMKLWLKLKKENVDPLWAQYKGDPMRFLSEADNALTKVCAKTRVYQSAQQSFVRALIEGGCNCACGSQMLLSLKEAYDMDSIGAALYPEHINIVHRSKADEFMVYETTALEISEWIPLLDYVEGTVTQPLAGYIPGFTYTIANKKQTLVALQFSPPWRLLYPIVDYYAHLISAAAKEEITKDMLLNTPRDFWAAVPLLQDIWDLAHLPTEERFKIERQRSILLKLQQLTETDIDAKLLVYISNFVSVSRNTALSLIVATYAAHIGKLAYDAVNADKRTNVERLDYFKKNGRINNIGLYIEQEAKVLYSQYLNDLLCRDDKELVGWRVNNYESVFETQSGSPASWTLRFAAFGDKYSQPPPEVVSASETPSSSIKWTGPNDKKGNVILELTTLSGCKKSWRFRWDPIQKESKSRLTIQ